MRKIKASLVALWVLGAAMLYCGMGSGFVPLAAIGWNVAVASGTAGFGVAAFEGWRLLREAEADQEEEMEEAGVAGERRAA